MASDAERVIDLYDRHARNWASDRGTLLYEKAWLDRFIELIPSDGSVLDLGCGPGEPIARYFIEKGHPLTGVDSSPTMVGMCRSHFLNQEWMVADMRMLSLERKFNGILA